MSAVFQPIPARQPPVRQAGLTHWLRVNLFADWKSALTTVVVIALALWYLPQLANWAIFQAIFQTNAEVCQQARGTGACWGVIVEKYRLIIFGRYPFEEQWRPELATGLLVGLLMASCVRMFWRPWLVLLWLVVLAVFFVLMHGGVLGLSGVGAGRWGGVPLTMVRATL
jgi:general L-amino acid transport system permease protein